MSYRAQPSVGLGACCRPCAEGKPCGTAGFGAVESVSSLDLFEVAAAAALGWALSSSKQARPRNAVLGAGIAATTIALYKRFIA